MPLFSAACRWAGGEPWVDHSKRASLRTVSKDEDGDGRAHATAPSNRSYPTFPAPARTAISATEQQPMRGALRGYLFYGYKRIMVLAPKFAIPLIAGESRGGQGNASHVASKTTI